MISNPSSLQYSGTSAAYDMNASTSGSATFARPSCSSASDVGMAVTGWRVDGAAGVAAASVPCGFGLRPPSSGVVNAVEGASRVFPLSVVDTVELVMAFEEEFNVEVPDEDAEKLQTVGDVIKYIEDKSSK